MDFASVKNAIGSVASTGLDLASSGAGKVKDGAVWLGHKIVWLAGLLKDLASKALTLLSKGWQTLSVAVSNLWTKSLPYFDQAGKFLSSNLGLVSLASLFAVVLAHLSLKNVDADHKPIAALLATAALVAAALTGVVAAQAGLVPVIAVV